MSKKVDCNLKKNWKLKQCRLKYPKSLRKVTTKQFLFGDFDKDWVKNVDDPKPFDPKVSKLPKKGEFYHTARFVGGEVKLSDELRQWQKYNNTYKDLMRCFLENHPEAVGRIKTVPSTMKKARERYVEKGKIGDIAGTRIVVKSYPELKDAVKCIKSQHETIEKLEDNYYEKPKKRMYYAHHLALKGEGPRKMELQVRTERMDKLAEEMHAAYKRGMTPSEKARFKEKAKQLARGEIYED